jgi:hypothetical protein
MGSTLFFNFSDMSENTLKIWLPGNPRHPSTQARPPPDPVVTRLPPPPDISGAPGNLHSWPLSQHSWPCQSTAGPFNRNTDSRPSTAKTVLTRKHPDCRRPVDSDPCATRGHCRALRPGPAPFSEAASADPFRRKRSRPPDRRRYRYGILESVLPPKDRSRQPACTHISAY